MSRPTLPRKPAYHASLFDPASLTDVAAVENALSQLEAILYQNNIDQILEDFLAKPNIPTLELVLSGLNVSIPLSEWILGRFPPNPDAFSASLSAKLLSRISLFFVFHTFPLSLANTRRLSDHRRSVEMAPGVLDTLSSMPSLEEPDQEDDEPEDNSFFRFFRSKPKTQRKTKQSKRITRVKIVIDPKPFQAFGVTTIPTTRQGAEVLALKILQDQKSILEFYLNTLRLPDVANAIKTSYIPQTTPISNPVKPKPATEAKSSISINVTSTDSSSEPTIAEIPSAYPIVQPMKAAMYFESVKGFGEWRILISTRADRDLREMKRKDPTTFKITVKKIKELSNGCFSDDNQKRLNGSGFEVPIYEAKTTRDSRIVYQVDCVPDYDSEVERQAIKVFGIYTHTQLNRQIWDSMGRQLGRKGKEYRTRCVYRNQQGLAAEKRYKPASFPPLEEDEVKLRDVLELPKDDLEEMHSLLVLEKFVTFSQPLLYSMLADLDVSFPFDVSAHEKKVIEHPHSCYVLGRSGTGKTTTMLFKMIWIEHAFELSRENTPKPRQIFVTQSRVLAGKVEEYFSKLLESLATTSQSPKELLALAKSRRNMGEEGGLVDKDDELNWRGDLPTKFSLLRDDHFPLFITFDRLCKMLEADFSNATVASPFVEEESLYEDSPQAAVSKKSGILLTYDIFLSFYWSHFSQGLAKKLDPALVFSEFMGIIKGSEEALTHPNGFLDEQTYESLSHRTHSTFTSQRNTIYRLFQLYMKKKRLRGDYDAADRTQSILKMLEEHGVPGRKIDYLYVDEAQDNLLIDALLLRSICRNSDGLFWAGDTAQTISVGSSFRFDDLKAFLFRVERRREENNTHSKISLRTRGPPQTFQLAINYRSHGGIVNCAHSIIGLITQFWPYAIDFLAQEQGLVDGLKPVFFSSWDKDTTMYEKFLFGASESPIEFGAQQCILVRDDAARDKLRDQVGAKAMILTLYESKGLEFNDVLLYNFFEDSTVELSQWRVVLNAFNADPRFAAQVPRFDQTRHAGVCSELKFLYVAITRARKNMWIIDCSERSEPMRVFWTLRNEVHNCVPGDDVPHLAASSSSEEWSNTGRTMFQNKRYLQAIDCFERASLAHEVAVSRAYYLREQARIKPMGPSTLAIEARRTAFLEAAQAFLKCTRGTVNEKRAYFRNAGGCFEHAGDDRSAVLAYMDGEDFSSAAKLYRKLGMFDEAVKVVQKHRGQMQADVADNVIDVARLYYLKEHELNKANELFSSYDEELEYMQDYDLDVARATLLVSLGRTTDAAELHLAEGRTLEAIQLFLEGDKEHSMRRGNECILRGLWQRLSIGIPPEAAKKNTTLVQLLEFSSRLNTALLDPADHDEIKMFQAIASQDFLRLKQLGQWFITIKRDIPALLCFDHLFTSFPQIQTMKASNVTRVLDSFLQYVCLLRDVAFHPDPCNNATIQKLFGFQTSTEDVFLLPKETYLHQLWTESQTLIIRSNDEGIFVSSLDLSRMVRQVLCTRLRSRVSEQHEICRDTQAFSPCTQFATFGYCNRSLCPREHLAPSALNPDWHNAHVMIHLQQIRIFHILWQSVDVDGLERGRQQRYWISRFYEAMNPPFYILGTPANLLVSRSPEVEKGLQVVRCWARDLLYVERYGRFQNLLTTVMRVATLSFIFDKEAPKHVYRAPVVNYFFKFPDFRRGATGPSIVQELLASLQGANNTFISEGIFFVKHVLQVGLPIDASALCDFLDYLCGAVIFAESRPSLHNITLPRSWFLALLKRLNLNGGKKDTRLLRDLLESMEKLLQRLHSGQNTSHLLFEGINLSTLPLIRIGFIARICRTLCLVGYNINNTGLRSFIVRILKFLRIDSRRPTPYQQYATANNWDHLARAAQQSTMDSPMDEMIQLYHESKKPGPHYNPIGVRRIFYKEIEGIPRLLEESSSLGFTSSLRPDAIPFVPRTLPDTLSKESQVEEVNEDTSPERPDRHNDGGEEIDLEGEVESPDVDDAGVQSAEALVNAMAKQRYDPALPPSEKQERAASIIQAAYRSVRLRRKQTIKAGLPLARARYFAACLAEAQVLQWPRRHYRLRFLGSLPHVLACLDTVHTHALTLKEKGKRRWKDADHSELEAFGKQITELVGILKDAKRLQKALEPKANIHRRRDLEELKTLVLEVEALIHRLPISTLHQVQEDLNLGLTGIVGAGRSMKKKRKPELCLDDDM